MRGLTIARSVSALILGAGLVVTGGGRAPFRPAQIAEIICNADGSATLLTPEIRTQPDGVHAWVTNHVDDTAYPVPAFGSTYVPPGEVREVVWPTPPGRTKIACWNHRHHLKGPQPKERPLVIHDVENYWTDTRLDCPPGEGAGGWTSDFISPGPQPPGFLSEAELRRAASREWNLRTDDRVELAGYPEEIGTRVRVVRGGRIVGTAALGRSEGRVVPTGGSFCSGLESKVGQ